MAKTPEQKARMKYTAYLRAQGRATQVDVAPVRAHLRELHDKYGMSAEMIAARCRLSQGSITEIIKGERRGDYGQLYEIKEIYRENAESALAVRPEIPTERGGARVNAIGTTRRIQALAALGYPVRWIGEQAGFVGQTFYLTAQGARKVIYFSTAYKIRKLYERLENDPQPERHGVSAIAVPRARASARRNGYHPPHVWDWDTIDDPEASPDFTGRCGTPQGFGAHYRLRILPVCEACKHAYNTAGAGKTLDADPGSEVL